MMARAKLTDVSGIGAHLAGRLRAAGLGSIAKLAAATPEDVAQVNGISLARAATFIAAAQELGGAPAPPQASREDLLALESDLREKIAAKKGGKGKSKKQKKKQKNKKPKKKKSDGKKKRKSKKGKKKKKK